MTEPSLSDLREEFLNKGRRHREPTMREIREAAMAGHTEPVARNWNLPVRTVDWRGHIILDLPDANDPESIQAARENLVDQLDRYIEQCGYQVRDAYWATDQLAAHVPAGSIRIHLRAELVERTDGEWPSIHQAVREDRADRLTPAEALGEVFRALSRSMDRVAAANRAQTLPAPTVPLCGPPAPRHTRPSPPAHPASIHIPPVRTRRGGLR